MITSVRNAFGVILVAVALMTGATSAGERDDKDYDATKLPCSDCHVCPAPTVDEPCLKGCMHANANGKSTGTQIAGPSKIIMGSSESEYAPVPFDHRAHARMEEMGGGCVSCHHYSTTKQIEACRNCHAEPRTLGQPGLKGIYHRQCLGCHQEWSHSNNCLQCHISSLESGSGSTASPISSDYSHNGALTVPSKLVYSVAEVPGEMVTFYHNEHSGKFGLSCKDCHHSEECAYCHDREQEVSAKKTEEELHAVCVDCHRNDNCDKCHGNEEKLPFAHAADHWRLGVYHSDLACGECHTTGKRITDIKADCNSCHSDWSVDNFVHSVTGFELDDIHADLDCVDCHYNRRFHDGPDCFGCHDDGRSANTNPPGIRRVITTSQLSPATTR